MLYGTQNPHGGDVYGAEVAFDFSSNVNPLGTPPNVLAAISHAALHVRQYPDPYCRALTAAIAAHETVPEDFILCGAGAAELIYAYCDALRPKAFKKHPPALPDECRRWIKSGETYAVRFGIEMLMTHYLDADFCPEYLKEVSIIKSKEYYVNMMIAWYFATALAKQYEAAVPYIEQRRLAPWTHNKTIRKAIESYRITDEQKAYLRTLAIRE